MFILVGNPALHAHCKIKLTMVVPLIGNALTLP